MTPQAKPTRKRTAAAPAATAAAEEDPIKGQIRKSNETRILAAAEKVFARAGFGGTTMAAIAAASDLPKANLHYYFGSKDVLYRAVLARTLGDWCTGTGHHGRCRAARRARAVHPCQDGAVGPAA